MELIKEGETPKELTARLAKEFTTENYEAAVDAAIADYSGRIKISRSKRNLESPSDQYGPSSIEAATFWAINKSLENYGRQVVGIAEKCALAKDKSEAVICNLEMTVKMMARGPIINTNLCVDAR